MLWMLVLAWKPIVVVVIVIVFPIGHRPAEVQSLEPNLAPRAVGSEMVVVGQRPETIDQARGRHGGSAYV